MLHSRKLWLAALALCVAGPARAAEVDKLTPADSQAVMVFNVRAALESPLAKKKGLTDLVRSAIDGNAEAKAILQAVGLDPLRDIDSVAIAVGALSDLQGNKPPEKMLMTVRGNFDPDRIDAAVKKSDKVTVSKEGSVTVYEVQEKKGESMFVVLQGKGAVVASPSKAYLLKAIKSEGAASKDLMKAAKKVDGKHSMWVAMVVTDEMRKGVGQNPQFKDIADKLESLTVDVNVTDSINLDINVNVTDGEAAKKMKVQVDAMIPFLRAFADDPKAGPIVKDVLDNLKVNANQDALNLNLKVSEETLDKIIKLAPMLKP